MEETCESCEHYRWNDDWEYAVIIFSLCRFNKNILSHLNKHNGWELVKSEIINIEETPDPMLKISIRKKVGNKNK